MNRKIFHSKPAFDDKYFRTKIKCYNEKLTADFKKCHTTYRKM